MPSSCLDVVDYPESCLPDYSIFLFVFHMRRNCFFGIHNQIAIMYFNLWCCICCMQIVMSSFSSLMGPTEMLGYNSCISLKHIMSRLQCKYCLVINMRRRKNNRIIKLWKKGFTLRQKCFSCLEDNVVMQNFFYCFYLD